MPRNKDDDPRDCGYEVDDPKHPDYLDWLLEQHYLDQLPE